MATNKYVELLNEVSRYQLSEIHQLLTSFDPVRFDGAGLQTIEEIIDAMKEKISFQELKSIAEKYHVACWGDCAWLLYQLDSFDDRDEERVAARRKLDSDNHAACLERLRNLEAIETLQSQASVISLKGRKTIDVRTDLLNDYMPKMMLEKLFSENESLYRSYLGIDEGIDVQPTLAMVPILMEQEKKHIEHYRQIITLKEGDRDVALRIFLFADLFHRLDVWEKFEKKGIVSLDVHVPMQVSWANTEKSSFIVEALAFYKVIPDYCLSYTPQEKFQYVKKKLEQCLRVMKKM